MRKNTEIEIETYEIEEAEWPCDEVNLDDYRQLWTKLGLKQQLENTEKDRIIPFLQMNTALEHVWSAYCPNKSNLNNFAELIPLRVLKIIEKCQEKKWFEKIEIWSETRYSPDPIVIGMIKEGWNEKKYLLARWGEALKPYSEIYKLARERWIQDNVAMLNERIAKSKKDIESIDYLANKYFNGEWINV